MEANRVNTIARCALALLDGKRTEALPDPALRHLLKLSGHRRLWLSRRDVPPSGEASFVLLARIEAPGGNPDSGFSPGQPDPVAWPAEIAHRLSAGQMVCGAMAEMTADLRAVLDAWGAASFVALPLMVFGNWWGTIRLESEAVEVCCAPSVLADLRTLADLFAAFFERQVAGQEHQERVKLVGALEMTGAVCHKLNQPMQVILGYSSMVSSGDVKDPEQVMAIVKTIEDETRKMGIITKNLMGITKYRSVASPGGFRMVHLGDDPAIG